MKIFKSFPCMAGGRTGFDCQQFHSGWKLTNINPLKNAKSTGLDAVECEALVPGNVRLSLLQAKFISDPFIGKNNEESKWVSEQEWRYSNLLNLKKWKEKLQTQFKEGGLIHIIFDGIDYDATFNIDGSKITRQIGMFSPTDLVTGITLDDKIDVSKIPIALDFHVQPWWKTHALKCQMAFGWDFAPEIRTIGIWKPVRISYTGKAYFSELAVFLEDSKRIESHGTPVSNVKIIGKIHIIDPSTLLEIKDKQTVELDIKTDHFQKVLTTPIHSGVEFEQIIENIELPLWNPYSLGESPLVPINITLKLNGDDSDHYSGYVSNRKIRWLKNPGTFPGNDDWTIEVNGKKMFLCGMNWVPPDSLFGRLTGEKYAQLIQKAKEIHIDMLRVWGGGIEEKSEFYEICDKEGIMVWQEFPFACTNYPRDPRYMKILRKECLSMLNNTRQYPSVVVYCGGNEFNPYINAHIVDYLRSVVETNAPDRKFFAVSPVLGDDHNWKVWGSRRDFEAYDIYGEGVFQMLTEFGMQAMPNLETVKQLVPKDINIENETDYATVAEYLQYHKADISGFTHYAARYGKDLKTVGDLIQFTQNMQAFALKHAIEVCRSAWPNVSGVFPWQFSDPWPNVSWSVLDYNLRPKLAYTALKHLYKPILPMVRNWSKADKISGERTGDVLIHNGLQSSTKGTLQVTIHKRKEQVKEFSFSVSIPALTVMKIKTISMPSELGTVLRLRYCDEKTHETGENFQLPAMEPYRELSSRIRDLIDVRFDGWWRKHLTKLMEQDRLRTDMIDWVKRKKMMQ